MFYPRYVVLFILFHHAFAQASNSLHYLEPGDSVENLAPGLRIFCHNAKTKYLIHMWKTLTMSLHTDLDNYNLYDGKTPSEVIEKHDIDQRSWKLDWFGTKRSKELKINPFEDICLGVYTYPYNNYQYRMSMTSIQIDLWKIFMTLGGIILFWSAKKLSRNPLFYYLTGVTFGVTFSIMIVVWFVSRFFSGGKTMYLMVGSGWLAGSWLARTIWGNAQVILMQYKEYVIWYLIATSTISFLICYRIGPVTNSRTKQIIQWFLQALGLALIYFSSHFTEASISVCILIFLIYNFPIMVYYKSRNYWRSMFPRPRKLLTDDEFQKQTIIETDKALGTLREFCSSPESRPWKTVLKLKDPIRFAQFIEGDSHLSEKEAYEHDVELTRLIEECEYTDDENGDEY